MASGPLNNKADKSRGLHYFLDPCLGSAPQIIDLCGFVAGKVDYEHDLRVTRELPPRGQQTLRAPEMHCESSQSGGGGGFASKRRKNSKWILPRAGPRSSGSSQRMRRGGRRGGRSGWRGMVAWFGMVYKSHSVMGDVKPHSLLC